MKKLLLLLVVSSAMYAADGVLAFSKPIIFLGDKIIQTAWQQANEKATEPLKGTIFEMYRGLKQDGYLRFMLENPKAIVRTVTLMSLLTDKNSTNDDVISATSAFAAAQSVPQDAPVEAKLEAWQTELKAFSIALIFELP